jgi:hypothetical protein
MDSNREAVALRSTNRTSLALLSQHALKIHALAEDYSALAGDSDFVRDAHLDHINEDTDGAARELCRGGLWRRGRGGYYIHEHHLLQIHTHHLMQIAS